MSNLNIFFKLTKVDIAKRTVEGIATCEAVDKSGEACHYETTKPFYQKWSSEIHKASGGKSLGNLRSMHTNIAAGKLTELTFDDAAKVIRIAAKVVDDAEWNKVVEGVYTGFSQGGSYVDKWTEDGINYYTADPSEVSLVDNPCLAAASFEVVKSDGSVEVRKFNVKAPEPEKPEQVWLCKDGTTRKKKEEALKRNAEIAAEEVAQAAAADIKELVKQADDLLDKKEFTQEERDHAASTGAALPDGSFPIHDRNDLENAIHALGRAKDKEKAKEHIIARAKTLEATDLLPTDWEGSTKDKSEKVTKMKESIKAIVSKSDTWDAACALEALQMIECLLSNEAWEALMEGEEEGSQIADLTIVVERLKTFIASEIQEDLRIDGTLERALGMISMKKGSLHASHAAHVSHMHKAAMMVMDHVQKCMKGDCAEKAENHSEHDHKHVESIHDHAQGIADKCMKMVGEGSEPMGDEHKGHVNDIHKSATHVMDAAHKFLHGEGVAKADNHTAHDVAQLHKMHAHAQDIAEKCVKMFEGGEEKNKGDDDQVHKLAKAEALNTSLQKVLDETKIQVGDLVKRIDHLERQPAVRKGALFAVDRAHEVQPGSEPDESAAPKTNVSALRLSPEQARAFLANPKG